MTAPAPSATTPTFDESNFTADVRDWLLDLGATVLRDNGAQELSLLRYPGAPGDARLVFDVSKQSLHASLTVLSNALGYPTFTWPKVPNNIAAKLEVITVQWLCTARRRNDQPDGGLDADGLRFSFNVTLKGLAGEEDGQVDPAALPLLRALLLFAGTLQPAYKPWLRRLALEPPSTYRCWFQYRPTRLREDISLGEPMWWA